MLLIRQIYPQHVKSAWAEVTGVQLGYKDGHKWPCYAVRYANGNRSIWAIHQPDGQYEFMEAEGWPCVPCVHFICYLRNGGYFTLCDPLTHLSNIEQTGNKKEVSCQDCLWVLRNNAGLLPKE